MSISWTIRQGTPRLLNNALWAAGWSILLSTSIRSTGGFGLVPRFIAQMFATGATTIVCPLGSGRRVQMRCTGSQLSCTWWITSSCSGSSTCNTASPRVLRVLCADGGASPLRSQIRSACSHGTPRVTVTKTALGAPAGRPAARTQLPSGGSCSESMACLCRFCVGCSAGYDELRDHAPCVPSRTHGGVELLRMQEEEPRPKTVRRLTCSM